MCPTDFGLGSEFAQRIGENAQELAIWTERVVQTFATRAIVLTGSRARNTFTAESDIDLLVIAHDLAPNFADRHYHGLSLLAGLTLPIEAFFYTPREARHLLNQFHVGILDALEFGLCMWQDGYWSQLVERFGALKDDGLKRLDHVWQWPASPRS